MPSRTRILPHYTYDDYVKWEGRWEVIEGIPFAMSPSPSPRHQLVASEMSYFFSNELRKTGCSCRAYQPIDVKIKDDVIVQPDLLILCRPAPESFVDFPPSLIVEILSPSTRLRDQNTKFQLYGEFGVKYYLMVDPDSLEILLYQLDDSGMYQLKNLDDPVSLQEDCSISLLGLPHLLAIA